MFARSDISIVCPIMQDPSPRVVWESLAAGVPVVPQENLVLQTLLAWS